MTKRKSIKRTTEADLSGHKPTDLLTVHALSTQLVAEFGRGFGEKNLRRMIQFAEAFPDEKIIAALLRQLGWTHFTEAAKD